METLELLEIIARGEDSQHQFKANVTNAQQLATEMIAFSNSNGGIILIGVDDKDGAISGLTNADINRLNNLISNSASQLVNPPIYPVTENIKLENSLVLVITISEGISKPYMDNDGIIYVKSGADKRKVTAREEIQRMYQKSGLMQADEVLVRGLGINDLDLDYFKSFFEKVRGEKVENQENPLPQLLKNMHLLDNDSLNVTAALLFSKTPQFRLPAFIVKAVCYPSNDVDIRYYLDNQDIVGKMENVFQNSLAFIKRQLHYIQAGQNINSRGQLEIPEVVLEELLSNALIHRDYFIFSPIRIFVFLNRIEIISPGHLPNTLSIENIKNGMSNMRNSLLASFATRILPYSGMGNGIIRVLKAYPHIEFEDDRSGNQFKVTIFRPTNK
jgi:ATP-dependent DNA helicase RecG